MTKNITRRSWLQSTALATAAIGVVSQTQRTDARERERRPIRVGQIGVAHAHATKLSVYRDSTDYEVVGVAETDATLWQSARLTPAFRNLPLLSVDQLLNDSSVDVLLIETHVRDLLATAEQAIAAGKHIHLDKPAGADLAHFQRIMNDAERKGLLVQMGYMYRYNPAVLLLQEFLRNGWLGDIFEVVAVMSKVVPAKERLELAEFVGGTMLELGCHVIDLVVRVLGPPERVVPFPQRSGHFTDTLHDNMLAVLEYPHALATVKSAAMEVDGFDRRHLTVCGTQGTFHIQPLDDPAVRLTLSEPRGSYKAEYQTINFPRYTRYVGDAADMAKIVRGDKSSDYAYAHDLAVQKVVLEASGMVERSAN